MEQASYEEIFLTVIRFLRSERDCSNNFFGGESSNIDHHKKAHMFNMLNNKVEKEALIVYTRPRVVSRIYEGKNL